jgi:lipid-binding SYLF domain-containing protein
MGKFPKLGALIALTALLFTASGASASDQTDLVAKAAQTADNMKQDPSFAPARDMLARARGMLIIPSLVKGGFIFGAEGGDGVLVAKERNGWSAPAFYALGSASFGLQAGLEQTQLVMLLMSDKALRAVEEGNFKFGAGAGLTVVSLSGGAEAATAANLSGDIIIWSSGKGLYGGLTLNGSVIKTRDEWNAAFYGRPVTVPMILAGNVKNPSADTLRQRLASLR